VAAIAVVAIVVSGRAARAEERGAHLFVGTRLGAHSFYFDSGNAGLSGHAIEGDLGVRLGSRYLVYAFLQQGAYDVRSDRIAPGPFATSFAFGIGAQASVNPEGPWDFVIDLSAGRRSLRVPYDTAAGRTQHGVDVYGGWEPLRVAFGPTVLLDPHVRVDLMAGAAIGRFAATGRPETCAIVAACSDSFMVDSDTQSATYYALELSIALHSWF
jgi:hypothetical protein